MRNIENTKPVCSVRSEVKMSAEIWGVPLENLYQLVLQYYRKEKEHLRLDYNQRMELLALFKQVKLGAYSPDKDTETGYFDVIGSDRRKAWMALGSRSKEEAQVEVVKLLEAVCPSMKEEMLKRSEELLQTRPLTRNGVSGDHHQEEFTVKVIKDKPDRSDEILHASANGSDSAINSSFHTNSSAPTHNGISPKRLTSQHSSPRSQGQSGSLAPPPTQKSSGSSQPPGLSAPPPAPPNPQKQSAPSSSPVPQPCKSQVTVSPNLPRQQADSSSQSDSSSQPQALNPQHQPRQLPLLQPSLWCSPNSAHQFMVQMSTSPSNTLVLSPGERLSVQVPTSPQASAVIWEFAVDHGDIGFGLYFQRGGVAVVEHLIPPSSRDCSIDLFIGKHQYQEQGVYLLEFINTHSSRQKTVFYRVFYQNATAQQ